MYSPSAPPPIFCEVREAHHPVTRLLHRQIIAHQPLSGNPIFTYRKSQGACQPLYRMALAGQVGVYRAEPRQQQAYHGKRGIPMHFYWNIPWL